MLYCSQSAVELCHQRCFPSGQFESGGLVPVGLTHRHTQGIYGQAVLLFVLLFAVDESLIRNVIKEELIDFFYSCIFTKWLAESLIGEKRCKRPQVTEEEEEEPV